MDQSYIKILSVINGYFTTDKGYFLKDGAAPGYQEVIGVFLAIGVLEVNQICLID